MRRCLICLLLDDPEKVQRPVHMRGDRGRAEEGYQVHRFDPGERRVRDIGRVNRRHHSNPTKRRLEVED